VTDPNPYRHGFPMTIIQHALWLYHRLPLSSRDVQELLHQRGIVVSHRRKRTPMRTLLLHETIREWCVKFGPLFTEELRHREPCRGSRWHLDEVCTSVDGIRHWLCRAVDEHGFVLDILLQRHRDTKAAKTLLTRLLGEYDVPEVIHTDRLRSYGAAIRELPSLADVDHRQVISTARSNNVIEQEHRSTRRQERSGQVSSWGGVACPGASVHDDSPFCPRSQQGLKRRKRAQDFLHLHARITNLHHHSRTNMSATARRSNQNQAFQTWSTVAAGVV
jgi:putative transposase